MSIKKICAAVDSNRKLPLYMKEATFVRFNPAKRVNQPFIISEGYQTIQHLYEKFYKPIEYYETGL